MHPSHCIFRIVAGAASMVALGSNAQTCTAGLVDTAFGPSTSGGYVQAGPILDVDGGTGDGMTVGSDRSIYAPSVVAFDGAGVGNQVAVAKFRPGGNLETTFGGFGLIAPPGIGAVQRTTNDAAGNLIVVQSDGVTSVSVSRFSASGVLDTGFGNSGVATFSFTNPFVVMGVVAGADGSTYVASAAQNGSFAQQPFVLKLTPAGQADSTFGSGGVSYVPVPAPYNWGRATDIALSSTGQVVVAGRIRTTGTHVAFMAARLLADGSPDPAFGTGGVAFVDFGNVLANGRRMAIQSDGKIVVAGNIFDFSVTPTLSSIGVIRLLANGQPDSSFGSGGQVTFTQGFGVLGYAMALQNNGKVLVAGASFLDAAQAQTVAVIVRFTATGAVDTAFGTAGVTQLLPPPWFGSAPGDITYDAGGKIMYYMVVDNAAATSFTRYLARVDSGSGKNCH